MEKSKYSVWQNCKYMLAVAWPRDRLVIWLVLLVAVLTIVNSVLGLLVTPAIMAAVESLVPLPQLIATILFFVAALMLAGGALAYLNTIGMFSRVPVRMRLVTAVLEKIETTSYPNTEDQDVRKLLDRAERSMDSNQQSVEAIWVTFTELLTNAGGFVIYLLLLSAMEAWILAVVLGTTVVSFFCSRYINGWGYRHREEEAEYSRRMTYVTDKASDYKLAKDLRIFGMQRWLEDMYRGSQRLFDAFIARRERVYILGNIIDTALSFLRNSLAYIYLIYMVVEGGLPASTFLLYFVAVGGLTEWVSGILGNFSTLHMQSLDISTVREFLEYKEPFKFKEGKPLEPGAQPYELKLEGLSFKYKGAEEETLSNINLTIKPGEKLAIVGLNGAGKTTLIKLLCGFYDPTEGRVLLNGQDIRQYNRQDYYRHFSAVFQDFSVLSTTIQENITQSYGKVEHKKLKHCIEQAGLTENIAKLPKGYETPVGREVYEEGIELSGGEMQRLMLARALYKNAPIIILDEPTAALDPIAERDIYEKYNELTGNKTSIYISHRLASTRFCDRIILIENGQITEVGTHQSLITKAKKYAHLFKVQSQYYQDQDQGQDLGGSAPNAPANF